MTLHRHNDHLLVPSFIMRQMPIGESEVRRQANSACRISVCAARVNHD